MRIIAEDRVNGASFTGSITAGLEIGRLVGGIIKPLILELGGSDPSIALEDTDIERATQVAMKSRFINT
jgi:succinate-semialdehyde dehydrogenase/glutarate-semialdehyde dehydrogenase